MACSALPLCGGPLCWVKIVKPQDYAKSPGLPPCAGGAGGRGVSWWEEGQVRVSPPWRPQGPEAPAPRLLHLSLSHWLGSWEDLSQAGGRRWTQWAGLAPPHRPTEALHPAV